MTPPAPRGGDGRPCHFCGVPVTETPIYSKTGNAVAHFECWYEGSAFHPERRDPTTGKLAPLYPVCREHDRP